LGTGFVSSLVPVVANEAGGCSVCVKGGLKIVPVFVSPELLVDRFGNKIDSVIIPVSAVFSDDVVNDVYCSRPGGSG